jgi:hypothetical protein
VAGNRDVGGLGRWHGLGVDADGDVALGLDVAGERPSMMMSDSLVEVAPELRRSDDGFGSGYSECVVVCFACHIISSLNRSWNAFNGLAECLLLFGDRVYLLLPKSMGLT